MISPSEKSRPRVLSGMRPTGKLHLGNYVGALQSWVKLQDTHDCFFFIADWHALTTDYDDTSRLSGNTVEVMLDYLAAGLDPEKCSLFVQSHVKQHAELHLLFSMITPLGWLERVPTYKDQQQNMPNKDLHMYGFLGYPLLQAADILIYRPRFVPVGEDQESHIELTREVARRFNGVFSKNSQTGLPVFPEPEVLFTRSPKLLGMDKRKMSKSYGNSILLSEGPSELEEKIHHCVTDRPKLGDKGNPSECPVGNLHQIFSPSERLAEITAGCMEAKISCVECKKLAYPAVNGHLDPIRERRHQLAGHPERLKEVIELGTRKAAAVAENTMQAVRATMGIFDTASIEHSVPKSFDTFPLRVPESVRNANTDDSRWEIQTTPWLEKVQKKYPLSQDRPRTFITRRKRKVGVHTASEQNGSWTFKLQDRPVNVLVLLAQDYDLYLHDYVLPPKVVQEHWKQMTRENGNVVIEIRKMPGDILLSTGQGSISIRQYESNYDELQ